MTYIVTGAAGFIGSNIVKALNERGVRRIIAVDDLTDGSKIANLADCDILDYWDKNEFIEAIRDYQFPAKNIEAVFHEGACSDTMEHDGVFMMANNYRYTYDLFLWCQENKIPLFYASSAAVYGGSSVFKEDRHYEKPLNVYGYSKFLFDQVFRRHLKKGLKAQTVGFRYFNVYGINEQHKGRMASVAFHHFNQYQKDGFVTLFGEYDGYGNGEQKRDFISVEDVVKVNFFFLEHPEISGIFNLGSGHAQSFNDLARATVNACRVAENKPPLSLDAMVKQQIIRYIDFPEELKGKYQSYTQAYLNQLRSVGYQDKFYSVEEGVSRYIRELLKK
ncbi:MAG: ADP-glyceromanno-heptose 6-epimerase [Neisseriaceae bacterium]|nr:ADP-glyceromanno-heptose 6-epimerase [Neisseriaceae bacterium]MBO7555308.1 ADP-glyceromanno-heptose 6-epimerase [Neisseriaceae bacterium]MBP5789696.1 ADP-glyceromanno-heptose 6-epimerase [Neisseriaceae bacterium]MBQ5429269.1 ADP-glyceromanno-heptose 6-epimerase [Neisseriaceae bacterium]